MKNDRAKGSRREEESIKLPCLPFFFACMHACNACMYAINRVWKSKWNIFLAPNICAKSSTYVLHLHVFFFSNEVRIASIELYECKIWAPECRTEIEISVEKPFWMVCRLCTRTTATVGREKKRNFRRQSTKIWFVLISINT